MFHPNANFSVVFQNQKQMITAEKLGAIGEMGHFDIT